jgi:putative drug exporter of the RND superfamily
VWRGSPATVDSPSSSRRGGRVAGISTTARVITSAALIMIVVFVGFALGDNVIVQQVGLGLAVAVLVGATMVRVALVPSTMVLLGDRNWWCPSGSNGCCRAST